MRKLSIGFLIVMLMWPVYGEDNGGHHSGIQHNHHGAIFLGATRNAHAGHTDFTVGGEYEYRIFEQFGVGLFCEMIHAEHSEIVLGVPVLFHLEQIKLFAAPGMVFIHSSHHGHTEIHREFLVRTGIGYDFHFGSMSVYPTVSLDFVHGHTLLVSGVGFGFGF